MRNRKIAFQYRNEADLKLLSLRSENTGAAICDLSDTDAPVKGLPRLAADHPHYLWYLPYTKQNVYECVGEFSPKAFIETASDALCTAQCATARLEYDQIFDTLSDRVTEKIHLGTGDLSGNTSGVKFQGTCEEILAAYDDILSAVGELPLALLSVICTYQDHAVAEIQLEFAGNADSSVMFKKLIKQHPGLRMMGALVPRERWTDWFVYVSGSHSPKVNTIRIPYERTSVNSNYQELMRSKYWGDPDWLLGDHPVKALKSGGEARINLFNWAQSIEIPATVCGTRITALNLMTNNKHMTRLTAPATVKKLRSYDLTKCTNLKEAVLPGVTEIKTTAFFDCKKLKELWVSDKLKYVDPDVFPPDAQLTIHAPEGSFAEQYAKRKYFSFEPT